MHLVGLVQCILGRVYWSLTCSAAMNVQHLVGRLIAHFVEEGPIALSREPGVYLCDGPAELFLGPIPNGH
jgi:hypothetical protein